ncbi:MAG: hypothetical protein M1133_06425 [Armatimonadetes bacterium]|nr:hypothetical protein [Armatimonadota bacterium]
MFSPGRLRVGMAVAFLLIAASSAWAGFRPRVGSDAGTVTINGGVAVRFAKSNGALGVADRARITAERLKQLVAEGVDPRAIFVKASKRQARIYAGERLICMATKLDARASRTTAAGLAGVWASRMRSLLLMPAVTLSDRDILVPLGESRKVTIGGAATGAIYAKAADAEVAAVAADDAGRSLQVVGQKLGSTQIDISVEDEHISLNVIVKKYAGRVADVSYAQVTGNPCPTSTMCYAAREAAKRSLAPEPGARFEMGSVKCEGGALGPNQSRRMNVEVRFSGGSYIPLTMQSVVEVNNVQLPRDEVGQLFYSNNPERLTKYQTLFAGKLEMDKSTRVLFHHQNAMGKRAHFIVDVVNPGLTPATFRVFRAVSNPMVDTVLVGYMASSSFLKDVTNDVSVIENVPGQSRLVLVSDMLGNQETTSGILQLRQMSGEPAYVRVASLSPGQDVVARGDIAAAPNPLILSLSDHIYPSPAKSLTAGYTVGGKWAFIPIGKHALNDETAQKKLYGNYGVTYKINVRVDNPTSETKKVRILFEPSAGLASGVFIIDGAFVSTKYAQPPSEVTLASYSLKPGETRNVAITTVPVAGSNYPATLVVRS